jgi:hypothetical protein
MEVILHKSLSPPHMALLLRAMVCSNRELQWAVSGDIRLRTLTILRLVELRQLPAWRESRPAWQVCSWALVRNRYSPLPLNLDR